MCEPSYTQSLMLTPCVLKERLLTVSSAKSSIGCLPLPLDRTHRTVPVTGLLDLHCHDDDDDMTDDLCHRGYNNVYTWLRLWKIMVKRNDKNYWFHTGNKQWSPVFC